MKSVTNSAIAMMSGIMFPTPVVLHKIKDGGVFGWDRIEVLGKVPSSVWTRPAFASPASKLAKAEKHPARTFVDYVWICICHSGNRADFIEIHDDEDWHETVLVEYEVRPARPNQGSGKRK